MTTQIARPATTYPISEKRGLFPIWHRLSADREYSDLSDILQGERIRTVFQPIISLKSAEVYGYEALSRITGASVFGGPAELFQAARQYGLICDLERLCRSKALRRAHELSIDKMISLNICPSVLSAPQHQRGVTAALIKELFPGPVKVILEITEYASVEDDKLFQETVRYYREQGFMIAIDDLGSGFASLKMLTQIEPHIVKTARFLIAGIHRSTQKRLLVEALVAFCHKINARVVAEGIETQEDLDVVIGMNIDFGQGYYLAKPAQDLQNCSEEARERILKPNIAGYVMKREGNFIGSIVDTAPSLKPEKTISSALNAFKNDQHLTSLPVVNDKGIPVGIVHKTKLFYRLGQQFGFALYSRKLVEDIMEEPLVFESDHSPEEVSLKCLERGKAEVYDALVVVKNGIYMGIVPIYKLLAKITEEKMNLAIQANPLTGLPGNVLIREEIVTRLERHHLFAAIYFDIDNFKPFNDNYGFEKGDSVIRFLGNLLKEKMYEWDTEGFVGHIGGDDFIAVCRPGDIESLCKDILRSFIQGIQVFFDAETIKKGYYRAVDRGGKNKRYPLLSLSIGVVNTGVRAISSYGELASVATEVKRKAKSIFGNSYYLDTRRQ